MGTTNKRLTPPPGRPGADEQALAAHLLAGSGAAGVAFVRCEEGVLWAATPPGDLPGGALVALLLGALAGDTWRRQRALRQRLWATDSPDPFALGAVQVLAKRLGEPVHARAAVGSPPSEPLLAVTPPTLPAPLPIPPALAEAARAAADPARRVELALAQAAPPDPEGPRWARDRAVAALLFAPTGELLGWARNRVGQHRAWHAELLLLLAWAAGHPGARLPAGVELAVGLEPCAMCAGLLWSLAADPCRLRVSFAQAEPGPAARGSILRPGSAARRRFARDAHQLQATPLLQVGPGGHGPEEGGTVAGMRGRP